MALGEKTGGRNEGVPNKLTSGAKDVIAQVAENIGGVARMTVWVREDPANERAFWANIYTKLLPGGFSIQTRNPLAIGVIRRARPRSMERLYWTSESALPEGDQSGAARPEGFNHTLMRSPTLRQCRIDPNKYRCFTRK